MVVIAEASELADILFRKADVRTDRPKPELFRDGAEGRWLYGCGCGGNGKRRGRPCEPPGSATDDHRSASLPWSFASFDEDPEPSFSIRGFMGALGSMVLECDEP